MKRIRKYVALAVYSIALVGIPMTYNAMTAAPAAARSALQLACYGTGSTCGGCC